MFFNSRSWTKIIRSLSIHGRGLVALNCFLQNHGRGLLTLFHFVQKYGRGLLVLFYFVQNHSRGSLAADNFEEISSPNYPRRLQR